MKFRKSLVDTAGNELICSGYCYGQMVGLPGYVPASDREAARKRAKSRRAAEREPDSSL